EELFSNGLQVLRNTFEFMNAPLTSSEVAAIYDAHRIERMRQDGTGVHGFALPKEFFRKGEAGDWRNALNPSERYLFDEAAGDLLCALGYSHNSWWADHQYERFTIPLLVTMLSRSRMEAKTMQTVKRALGPKWIERIVAVRSRFREKMPSKFTAANDV